MTHYIEKDQTQRNAHAVKRPASGKRMLATPQVSHFHMLLLATLELKLFHAVNPVTQLRSDSLT